ncbi:hypothetical protein CBF23_002115 [Marinomonas agarivorans]|nr:hypothetical protein CBF23_002115 [Marinomonas agarivorans]
MLTCPHCKAKGISVWAKLWSGSYTSVQCASCGHYYCIRQTVKRVFCGLRYAVGLIVFFVALLFDPVISLTAYAVFLITLEYLLALTGSLTEAPEIKSQRRQ